METKIGFIGRGETVRGTVARGCRYFEKISYNLNSACKAGTNSKLSAYNRTAI
jgi:hypothetical protein